MQIDVEGWEEAVITGKLCLYYAMPGTDIAYSAMPGTDIEYSAKRCPVLSQQYHAMPGTVAAYGTTRCPVLTQCTGLPGALRTIAAYKPTIYFEDNQAKLPFMPALLPFMGKTLLFMLVLPPFREVVPPLLLVLLRFVDPILLFTEALTCVGAVWARVPCDLAGLPRGDETASRTRVPLFPSRDTLLQPSASVYGCNAAIYAGAGSSR
eukprot:2149799-Rhodomonas_salina.4